MAVQVYTYWKTLLELAYEEGQARLSGDAERLAIAEANHAEYKRQCLDPNTIMITPSLNG